MSERPSVVTINLKTRLKDIPEGPPCYCGQKTKKAYLEHLMTGESVVVQALRVAGYKHEGPDGYHGECYSDQALVESLQRASEIMLKHGDLVTPRYFQESIARLQTAIDEQKSLAI